MSYATKRSRGRLADGAPNPIDAHVGNRMRLRRITMGLSQEELGELIGLTFQQIQKYERGANRVGASRLFDLSRALGVTVGFFFDDMPPAVALASPAAVATGNVVMLGADSIDDPMKKRETLELMRAYNAVPDESVRKSIFAMVKAVSGQALPASVAAE